MLSILFGVALSPMFTFLVGKDQTPISIHADLVKNISAPLDAMTNNGVMTESITRVVILDDVGVEVFQKFCQFAYTGDYTLDETAPDQEDKAKDSAGTTAKMEPDAEKPSTSKDNSPAKTSKALSTSTSYEFQRLRTRLRGQFQQLRRTSNLTGHQLNYIAKIHIDIFIFANKYPIESMRRKCLDYLHYELDNIKPCPTTEKIVKMLKYIHDCTTPYEPVGMSDIHNLIYRYASCHIRDVAFEPSFQKLIRDRPFIASSLFKALTVIFRAERVGWKGVVYGVYLGYLERL